MFILPLYQGAYSIALPFSLTFPAPHPPLRSKPALYKNSGLLSTPLPHPSTSAKPHSILQQIILPLEQSIQKSSTSRLKTILLPHQHHHQPTINPPHRLTSPYADHVHQRHLDVLLRQRQHRGALPGEMSRVPAYQVFRVQGRETRCVAAGCSQVEPSFV